MTTFLASSGTATYQAQIIDKHNSPILIVKEISEIIPTQAFDPDTSQFFNVSRSGQEVTLTENKTPTSEQLAWWLMRYVSPNSATDAATITARQFPDVDADTRSEAIGRYTQSRL